jgi:hypothetical protein
MTIISEENRVLGHEMHFHQHKDKPCVNSPLSRQNYASADNYEMIRSQAIKCLLISLPGGSIRIFHRGEITKESGESLQAIYTLLLFDLRGCSMSWFIPTEKEGESKT